MLGRLGIGAKLTWAFGALAGVTVLVVLSGFLAGRSVTEDIRRAEAVRAPASRTSAQAQASLMRMQLHVRGYLVLGDPQDIEHFQAHKRDFEIALASLRVLATTWPDDDASKVAQLTRDYEQWVQLPQKLFELHDNPLENRPALRLARLEVQPRKVEVLTQVDAIIGIQKARELSAADRELVADLVSFQTSFDAMVTNLMAYAVSGELSFKLAYGPQLATNAAQWRALFDKRDSLDRAQRERFDLIAQRRAEIGELALSIVNMISGERGYEDLYLYRTQAAPRAQSLLGLFEALTAHQQKALQADLGRAGDSLSRARVLAVLGGLAAIALASVLAFMSHRLIVGPLRRLTAVAEQVAAGDLSAQANVESGDEIGRLAQTINTRLRKEDLQQLMASVSDALWSAEVASDGSFAYRYYSPVVERITGLPAAHFLESPQRWLDMVHADDRPTLAEGYRRVTSGATDREDAEYRIVRSDDGAVRWVRDSVRATRLGNGHIALNGVVSDITARKTAEGALRESEARFRSLTAVSSDWYWKQDEDFRFTYLSSEVYDLAGYTAQSSIGKTRWELSKITPLSCSWPEHQAVLAAHQAFRDLEYCRSDPHGRPRYISVSGAPMFDEQGRFKGYQGVGRNITERKAAQDELLRLERQLRQAQRLEAMGTLAGGIAHDFNNILGAILGYGEMALRDVARGSRLRRDLDSIMAAGERGRALVDRILAFSRSGVGERIPVHVEAVVREALGLIGANLPDDITIEAQLQAGRAAMLGDPTQVHQVLMNLATNAVQAMGEGGTLRVSLHVEQLAAPRMATTGSVGAGEYVVLAVQDNGSGITKEVIERIFDPFFTTKEVGVGTGLGLSLVHGIVGEVGGAIDVQSTVHVGSVFTVYLPRAGDAEDDRESEAAALPRGNGQQILVVDDEEPLVRLTSENLAEWGYAPVGFTSSKAALEAFRAHPERYDAVISDERMPGLSGSALLREVRAVRPALPMLLVSGYVGAELTSRAKEAGVEEVLKKPLSMRDLALALARALRVRGGGTPNFSLSTPEESEAPDG